MCASSHFHLLIVSKDAGPGSHPRTYRRGTPAVLDQFFEEFLKTGVDISSFHIDHIAYLAIDTDDYESEKEEMVKFGDMLDEQLVQKIHVAIYKLKDPIKYKDEIIRFVEIIEPKEPREYGMWEHVEFVSGTSPEVLVEKYPKLDWKNNLGRDIFPMITLKLANGMKVKFPRLGVVMEIDRLLQPPT